MEAFSIYPFSEKALVVQFQGGMNSDTHQQVMLAREVITQSNIEGLVEVVPAFDALTLYYDPLTVQRNTRIQGNTPFEKLRTFVTPILEAAVPVMAAPTSLVKIPVCYGGQFGPDLDELGEILHMPPQEIIRLHCSVSYTVFMIGFAPGFPYMGELPRAIHSPRKTNPRLRVPEGSVGLAGAQTGIYPIAIPGGWQIIGQTPLRIFNLEDPSPCIFEPGQRVQFEPISPEVFHQLKAIRP